MRSIVFAAMLLGLCSSAFAEWIRVGGSGGTSTYADLGSIKINGSRVKMWILFNYLNPQNGALSSKGQEEFDCKTEESRTIYIIMNSGNMGTGEVIYSGAGKYSWAPIPPQSSIKSMFVLACRN